MVIFSKKMISEIKKCPEAEITIIGEEDKEKEVEKKINREKMDY